MSLSRPSDQYSPLYFLASLGAGGLMVSFFMWLMHWLPHPGRSVPVFEDIAAAFSGGNTAMRVMIVVAVAVIAYLGYVNLLLLVWNLIRLREWRGSDAHARFVAGNAQSQMMALPLALAMAVNGGFVLGLVFVPGLWGVVEYLFPAALAAC